MSDLKAAFRAAKEQRGGSASLTAAQVRALREKAKEQPKQAAQQGAGAAPAPPAQRPVAVPKPPAAGLPADFFEPAAKRQAVAGPSAASQPTPPAAAPKPAAPQAQAAATAAAGRAGAAAPVDGPVPEGFFADKAADAKARGVKLPDAKDREEEFQAFQRMMEEQLKQVAAREAEEAEEEAGEREDREGFEQWLRIQRMQELVQPHGAAAPDEQAGPSSRDAALLAAAEEALGLPRELVNQVPAAMARRKRVIDTLRELGQGGGGEGGSSEDEESESEEGLLDWRAKTM